MIGRSTMFAALMITSACTPDARKALLETSLEAIQCAIMLQDLPNDRILKECGVKAIDADKILAIVGQAREESARAALEASTRADCKP